MRTLGALLELAAAGAIAYLWAHGYLTNAIDYVTTLLAAPPPFAPARIAGGGNVQAVATLPAFARPGLASGPRRVIPGLPSTPAGAPQTLIGAGG